MLSDAPNATQHVVESSTAEFSVVALKKRPFRKVALVYSAADADTYLVEADRVIESPNTALETVFVAVPDAESARQCLDASKGISDVLDWDATWELVDGVLTARYPESSRDRVAATSFDFYSEMSRRLGATLVQAHSFDLDSGSDG